MIWQDTPYTIPLIGASALSVMLGLHIALRRPGLENKIGALIIFADTEWIMGYVLELSSGSLPLMIFWDKIQLFAFLSLPTLWFIYTLYYTGHEKWVTRYSVTALIVVPCITALLAITNGAHGLIWRGFALNAKGPFLTLDEFYGRWFWFYTVYAIPLVLWGIILFIQTFIQSDTTYKRQITLVLVGLSAPVTAAVVVLTDLYPLSNLNLIPFALVVTNAAVALDIVYFWLGDIRPLARETVIEHIRDSVIVLDKKNRIVDLNSSAQQLMGGSAKSTYIGNKVSRIWDGWSSKMESEILSSSEGEIVLNYGKRIYDVEISPLVMRHGSSMGKAVVLRDITDRTQVEKAEKYRLLAENVTDVIWIMDKNLRVTYISPSAERLLGYTAEEVLQSSWDSIVAPSSREVVERVFEEESSKERRGQDPHRSRIFELELIRKDGPSVWVEVKMSYVRDADGNVFEILGVSRDITERKRAEEQILQQLKEKEVLLQEIHHRVKNNLQVISSLLSLQSQYIKDKRDMEMLRESQDRIRSMALIHEELYKSKDLANINFEEYIKTLVSQLFRSYGVSTEIVTPHIQVENITLRLDTAIPCGLIINELVSNCLKHAFPDGRTGEITVDFRAVDEVIRLRVRDNGIGMPDIDFRNTDTLGLHLVTILAEDQLDGEIAVTVREGTEFCITFREEE